MVDEPHVIGKLRLKEGQRVRVDPSLLPVPSAPEADPSIYLTASLGITFPFMLILGVPMVWQMTAFWQGL